MKFLVINGPNINMLGIMEVEIYGNKTYEHLLKLIDDTCHKYDIDVEVMQSNHEGAIIDAIHGAYGVKDGIIINPGALAHTSIAILDALRSAGVPTVEVHIADLDKRESFRKTSYVSLYASKVIQGWGIIGYVYAIMFLKSLVEKNQE